MAFLCPLCHSVLSRQDQHFQCEQNHQFDIAKEGYINLMPSHHKRSKDPGDNKEMMQARRRFLDGGHYHRMREQVAALCRRYLTGSEARILDIGCGEGYYTAHIADVLKQTMDKAEIYGLDISKTAIRYASKRYPNCEFCVASSHRLPFEDGSLNAIVRIYAPCKDEELHRVLADDGIVVTITPAGRHLYQLKEKIYQDVRLHDESPEIIEGFDQIHQQQLHYPMSLTGPEALDLLQMTPFAWRAPLELRAELSAAGHFQCEADFMLTVYRKKKNSSL